MPPLVYCDNNFLVTAHQSANGYQDHLRGLVSSGKLRFAISPWHWLDIASDKDHARGSSMADFCDSLSPLWFFDRRTIQIKEVAIAFYRFANLAAEPPVMAGEISDIIYDLLHTRAHQNCRAFVEFLRSIGPTHPLNVTFKKALEGNEANTLQFLAGKLTPGFLSRMERKYIEGMLPPTTPAGIQVDEGTKRAFLGGYKLGDCPAIALETKITYDNWRLRRSLKRNTFLDQQHVMAVPYADIFITDDAQLSKVIKRAVQGVGFRTAHIQIKAEFDAAFPSSP